MARDPFVAFAGPVPISAEPNVSRRRRHADDFLSRRRRRHHYDAIGIMSLVGYDDAPGKSDAQAQTGGQARVEPSVSFHEVNHVLQS
jgi:hypothetical protein